MKYLIFSCILFLSFLQAGEIRITDDFAPIADAVEHFDEGDLVLFDVDGTLIVPDDLLLKTPAKRLFETLTAGHPERDLFREIRLVAPHSHVDGRSIFVVQRLQANYVPTLALTAAPAKIKSIVEPGQWRVDELKQYGFDFSLALPEQEMIVFPKPANHAHDPLYLSGVIFSSFLPKGDILLAFLQAINWKPKRVVFVDDEMIHVQSVVSALEKQGIECIGFHYTAVARPLGEVDEEFARHQVDYFIQNGVWLKKS